MSNIIMFVTSTLIDRNDAMWYVILEGTYDTRKRCVAGLQN